VQTRQTYSHSPKDESPKQYATSSGTIQPFTYGGSQPNVSRHEPLALSERARPVDPYTEWLQQREAERERDERPEIRWVSRPRIVPRPITDAQPPASAPAREQVDRAALRVPVGYGGD